MNILITIPNLTVPHGGTRVILEWAVRLMKWHDVTLYCSKGTVCPWYKLPRNLKVSRSATVVTGCDALIICSPHDIDLQEKLTRGQKCFVFMQMVEHLFRPGNTEFEYLCTKFYLTEHPMIAISNWNSVEVRRIGRTGAIYYVGNGVNTEHFPIEREIQKENTILVEGWDALNPTKDTDHIAAGVAEMLRKEYGFKVVAYGQHAQTYRGVMPDEYYQKPSLSVMNDLYRRSILLLKASHCDARACAPMEAMTKGTVTVRAIDMGDDDLIHGSNCLRVPYNEAKMYEAAKSLIEKPDVLQSLRENCYDYVTKYSWDYWMNEINKIIVG